MGRHELPDAYESYGYGGSHDQRRYEHPADEFPSDAPDYAYIDEDSQNRVYMTDDDDEAADAYFEGTDYGLLEPLEDTASEELDHPRSRHRSDREGGHRLPDSGGRLNKWVRAALLATAVIVVSTMSWNAAEELLPSRGSTPASKESSSEKQVPPSPTPPLSPSLRPGPGPGRGPERVTTVIVDQSMPTLDEGTDRLLNVTSALIVRIAGLPPVSEVGLWTFDGVTSRVEVPTGPLNGVSGTQPRSTALSTALDRQYSSSGGAVSFTTLKQVYADALEGFVPGRRNSVLIITSGPHTDQTLDGAGVREFIRRSVNSDKPVVVDVIDFGDDLDRSTWQEVARISGGEYLNPASSSGLELTSALDRMIG
jgi:hypothetical protein